MNFGKSALLGRALLIAIAIQMLGVRTASAQLTPGPGVDEVRKLARIHFGSVFVRPTLTLDNVGVDTNVFNVTTGAQSDVTGTMLPRVETWSVFGRRGVLAVDGATGLVYFKTFASERSVDPAVRAQAQYVFAHLTVLGAASYTNSHQRSNNDLDARVRRTGKEIGLGVRLVFSPKLGVDLSVRSTRNEYDRDRVVFGTNLSQSLDGGDRILALAVRNQLTPKTTFVLRGETHRSRFDTATVKNGDTVRLTTGLELSPRALISGTADLGVMFFNPVNAAVPAYTGMVAKFSIDSNVLDGTRLGLTWDRDLSYSYESATPYYLIKGIGGSIRRQLIRDTDVIVSGNRTAYEYQSLIGVSGASRQDVTTTWSMDFGYRVNRDMRVGFAVAKWQRTSTSVAAREYSGLRAGVTVTYAQSQ